MPIERGTRYEDPLDLVLADAGLGETTGGGAQLGSMQADGTRAIVFCGIDVELTELNRGRAVLREKLQELGAPVGTELHFSRGEARFLDHLGEAGWVLDQPRTELHPGFGI